jgi:ADP-ribosylarginine hydrolase
MNQNKFKAISFQEKKKASMIIGSYLDTLGFNHGIWEFNFNTKIKTFADALYVNNEIIQNFFNLGGFNINISQWPASDDTIMMIATMKACLKGGKIVDFIKYYLEILPILEEKKRASGTTTLNSLRILEKYNNINKIPYSSTMGGNGAAMRTSYIGIHFSNIEQIIEISIESSRLTHNYPLGFLGGMVTALFTRYAIDNIDPWKWCDLLLDLNETVDRIVKKIGIHQYAKDKDEFWDIWRKYKEMRLNKFDQRGQDFLYSYQRFMSLIDVIYTKNIDIQYDRLGGSGGSATIIAYDSILMSIIDKTDGTFPINLKDPSSYYYNWQTFVVNSTLHFGDNDTIGAIAGCWYGALKGFDGLNILEQLEYKNEFKKYL